MSDIVRVVRVLEYVGERSSVEKVLSQNVVKGFHDFGVVTIREAIMSHFPEVIVPAPSTPPIPWDDLK